MAVRALLREPVRGPLSGRRTYFLARELELSRPLALVAASILGGCAVLLFQASQAMSDVVAALWATAAVVFALRARKRDIWALLAGASFGLAVLVRPIDVSSPCPRWHCPAMEGVRFVRRRRHTLRAVRGSMEQHRLRRGAENGLRRSSRCVCPRQFPRAVHPLRPHDRADVFAARAARVAGVAADRRLSMRDRALLLVWFAAYLLMYCFWGPYEAWWYTRFLIPAFPALVVGAVLVAGTCSCG